MLSQKISTQVNLIAYSTVSDMFALFQNPEMRGENFSWANFPEMMQRKVEAQVFINLIIGNKSKELEAKNLGGEFGKQIAQNMVNLMLNT